VNDKEKIKVLHVSSESTWRGGEQQIAYLISELDKLGVESVVLCKSGSIFESYCEENRIKFYSAHFTSNLDLKTSLKLKKVCKYEEPDLIHAHTSRAHSLTLYSTYFGVSIPIVVSRRVDFPIKTPWKYDHNAVKRIICVSDSIKSIVIEKIRNQEKCITIHSGIDTHKFSTSKKSSLIREYGIEDSFKSVGNTSAIADHKDYFTFVDTAREVLKEKKDVVFFIIGDGPLESQIREYININHLDKSVILTGFREDIIDILPGLDCFLMTSKTEGLGTSLLDAMAAGVPVVATKGGGIPEIIIHEKTGLISDVGDSISLSVQVIRILEDIKLRHSLIQEGLNFVDNFTSEEMARLTFAEYTSILN